MLSPLEGTSFAPSSTKSLNDLIAAGVIKPPLPLQRTYLGHLLSARVEPDGRVSFGGQLYNSLSKASGTAVKSIIGGQPGQKIPATNGWTFWQYRDEAGDLKPIDVLRDRL